MAIRHVILLICGFGVVSCFDVVRKYYYVNLVKNWADAQNYCRTKYTDLAVIENKDDVRRLIRPTGSPFHIWIGLHDDPQSWKGNMGNDTNSWKWSTLGAPITPIYQNWGSRQPNYYAAIDTCVKMEEKGTWNDEICGLKFFFVCYQDSNITRQKTYTLQTTSSTWMDAQTYCRKHFTDLAVIENEWDNSQVLSVKGSSVVWIGLSRIPWRWSDNSSSSFRYWRSGQPNNYHGDEYCVLEDSDQFWHDDSCTTERPFWCYEAVKAKKVVRMVFQSHADLSDPDINPDLLQQIRKMAEKQGWTDFKLQWKTPPRKQGEEDNK